MDLILAIDFGSTFTKISAFDIKKKRLVAQAQARTTVETDVSIGLEHAKERLFQKISGRHVNICKTVASSSAAGGLKMVAIGLTQTLTTKAAQEAVLGAGAKLVKTYSYNLTNADIDSLEKECPDLVLLSGGTDGGDEETVIHNAGRLAESRLNSPIIYAGNRQAADKVADIFQRRTDGLVFTENIFPILGTLNIEPAQKAIRELFVKHITKSKGLDKVEKSLCEIVMPTPRAVLQGATIIAEGTDTQKGWGDLIVLDIGGATTDVHSIGHGYPTGPDTIFKGIPEPLSKRTVEGDLGIRFNASTIVDYIGLEEFARKYSARPAPPLESHSITNYIKKISGQTDWIPIGEHEKNLDLVLGEIAVETAVSRHVGTISDSYLNGYNIRVQRGKDLTGVRHVIGTGGIVAFNQNSLQLLECSRYRRNSPHELRPKSPILYRDKNYLLYAIGLIGTFSTEFAFELAEKYIEKIEGSLNSCPHALD
jgi:uncharacterized protein (TIGR01319 family)